MDVSHIEALSGGVRWTIKNFSTLKNSIYCSDIFLVGDCPWYADLLLVFQLLIVSKVVIYPKGIDKNDHLSIFLNVADGVSLPIGWSRDVKYSLALIDQLHNKSTIKHNSEHKFDARDYSWGYPKFVSLLQFCDAAKGFIVNDTSIIEVEVTVRAVVPKNQGASFMSIRADVKEYPNSYAFLVEMPGLKLEDFNVQLVDNNKALLISGEQNREKEVGVKYATAERRFGNFSRKFLLPDDMNTHVISAIYKDGVLTVTGDKVETIKPKTIEVKLGSNAASFSGSIFC
ncbi:protein RESTRICTED TEV MOVEMENT 3-like [Tasmannia lanceolata]|uniref:protein RESTRICTED TEV MOVEMENT 3-like n=1 Tax=Tasmannia lanceolata TaxID=3420 RepID=UPI004063499B